MSVLATPDESEDPVKDAEEDDPEYNYLEEAEQYEQYDSEDFRDDRAVKVSSKMMFYWEREECNRARVYK